LPFVMRYNLPVRKKELGAIARLLGEDTTGLEDSTAAELAIDSIERLRADIGIPLRLRDLGVQEGQLRLFAEKALGIKRIVRVNPRVPTLQDLEGILRAAL